MGIKQDNSYKPFIEFKNEIINATQDFENIIFVSGHDHNQQFIEINGQSHIISGAGSKENAVGKGRGLEFASTEFGYSTIEYFNTGEIWITFYECTAEDSKEVYRRQIQLSHDIETEALVSYDFPEVPDTVSVSIYEQERTDKKGFYRFFWGDWYREVYGLEVDVPTATLDDLDGGVFPVKRGGGMATNSLRLESDNERQYVLRSMVKDGTRTLSPVFRKTFVVDMMQDFFTTAHPYAAFIVPTMADAVGVYHTNPKLLYVPKHGSLGRYNQLFGNELYLYEERPNDDRSDIASFGYSDDIISTSDVLENLVKSHKHKVNDQQLVKSRLFDITIGDWDRHEDQWRWATFEQDNINIYEPIPRDRDQVFATFDGFFTRYATKAAPNLRPMQVFDEMTEKVHWFTWDTRRFDRRFLNQSEWSLWQKEVEHIQENLTDDVIEEAIGQWPKKVYERDGKQIIEIVKKRRDNLGVMARKYYDFLAKSVDVLATNDNDYIEITRQGQDETRVVVYTNEKKKNTVFERVFHASETNEIIIYGLEGKDKFYVHGTAKRGPKVRLVGGQDEDIFIDESKVGGGKKTIIYDAIEQENEVNGNSETKDRRSRDRFDNQYFITEAEYPFTFTIPYISFANDDGLFLGGLVTSTKPKFKKRPVGVKHTFDGNYAFVTQGFKLSWEGEYTDAIGNLNLITRLGYQAPQICTKLLWFGK